jgi:hypothetical protein
MKLQQCYYPNHNLQYNKRFTIHVESHMLQQHEKLDLYRRLHQSRNRKLLLVDH